MSQHSQYLIQYLLRSGSIRYNDADNLLKRCSEKLQESPRDIKLTINELNQKISGHSFYIDVRTCEISGEKMFVIVNTRVDDMSKTAIGNTPAEVQLFEAIVEAIMTSEAKWVSAIRCMNLTSKLENSISKDSVQECLEKWSENGYLIKEDGLLYLGARAISEFESHLRKEYPTRMTICKICTSSVYYGKICANCYEVTHKHCINVFWKKDKKCPSCKKPWKEAEGRIYEEDTEENNDESMNTPD